MRGLAALARDLGDGDIRLTVWQNLLISGVRTGKIEDAKRRIAALGLDWQATSIRAGLVACTGSTGCRFAGADTKGHAEDIARLVRGASDAGQPRQHPPHRLPPFLRAALHRRHRPHRREGCRERGGRHGRRLSTSSSAAASAGRGHRPRTIADIRAEDVPAAVERCCGPTCRTAPGQTKPSRPSRAATTSKPCRPSRGSWPHERPVAAPFSPRRSCRRTRPSARSSAPG